MWLVCTQRKQEYSCKFLPKLNYQEEFFKANKCFKSNIFFIWNAGLFPILKFPKENTLSTSLQKETHYIYIYIYIYIYLKPQKFEMCIYKRILKTPFLLQIFRCLYEIFYSVYGSNIVKSKKSLIATTVLNWYHLPLHS